MEPSDLDKKFPQNIRRTRLFVRKNSKIVQGQRIAKILLIFCCCIPAASWGYLNFYFSILISLKFLVIGSVLFQIIAVISDSEDIIEYWKEKHFRSKIIKEKLLYTAYQNAQIILIVLVVYSIYHIFGLVDYWEINFNIVPSNYQVSTVEGILLAIIWILSAIAIWVSSLWYTGKFVKIKRYSEEKGSLVLDDIGKIVLALFLIFTIFYLLLFIIFDNGFILYKAGRMIDGAQLIVLLGEKLDYWILVIEIVILSIYNLVLYIASKKAIITRNNFVTSLTDNIYK